MQSSINTESRESVHIDIITTTTKEKLYEFQIFDKYLPEGVHHIFTTIFIRNLIIFLNFVIRIQHLKWHTKNISTCIHIKSNFLKS